MSVSNESGYQSRLELSLFLLRLGVFVVMLAWTVDKIVNPLHAIEIFQNFYFIQGISEGGMITLGVIELVFILVFLAGLWKPYTYGLIILLHTISAIAPWEKYTVELGATYSMLYYADWSMLAACITLYVLRDLDVKFILGQK